MESPPPPWILLLSLVGLVTALRLAASAAAFIYRHFLRRPKDLARCYGRWALVSGPTDGIGRALAGRLAERGLNLLLVARSPDKLATVAGELRAAHGVDVRTLALDLACADLAGGVRRIREAAAGLDLGLVVNNAGTTYPAAMYLHEVGEDLWRTIVGVNLRGLTMVTAAVLPEMLRRGRGAVVCVGSGSATAAVPAFPFFAVYAATKAYVHQLCKSLHVEYKELGIDVQCQIPMYVATKMAEHKKISFFVPTTADYARSAVAWIGYEGECVPHWTHAVQLWLVSLLPDALLEVVVRRSGLNRRRDSLLQQANGSASAN